MAKGNDFKKPVNNQDTIIDEDEKNKKLIIIVCLSIIVVLGLIIASITYFNNRQVEDDKKNNKDNKKPTEIIKKPVDEKPVDEKPTITNPTYNYVKPSNPVAVVPEVPEEPEEKEQPVTSETEDYTVTVDENNVVKLVGTSRYIAKVDSSYGPDYDKYNNFIRVKVSLDSSKLSDLDKLTITTKVKDGFRIYGKEVLASTEEEIQSGNLYFYWTQAIGDGMPKNPTIDIDYGDGNSETYILDISELTIETPMEDVIANDLVAIPTKDEVVGGQDRTYQILVLESKPSDDIEFKDDTITADLNNEVASNGNNPLIDSENSGTEDSTTNPKEGASGNDPNAPSEGEGTGSTEPKAPEDKDYTLKFTGTANYYDKNVFATVDADLANYNYVLAVKILAPGDITDDEIKNFSLTVTKQNGTKQDLSKADGVIKTDGTRKYIYLYYAIDEDLNARPEFIIDWDGEEGTKYGKVTYTFDFSELDKAEAPEKEPEEGNPTEGTGTGANENQGQTGTQSGDDTGTPEGGTVNPPEPETSSTQSAMNEVSPQTNMNNLDVSI